MAVRLLLALALIAGVARPMRAGEGPTFRDLRRMSLVQLDELFAGGTACELPVGVTRGHVVHLTEAKCPRLVAAMQSALWKGKEFYPGGEFINQFCGFRADPSHAKLGPSWFDGKPCVVLEYPTSARFFANTRDEIRQIAPCVYLGRFHDRCPCPKLKGYFVLEIRGK